MGIVEWGGQEEDVTLENVNGSKSAKSSCVCVEEGKGDRVIIAQSVHTAEVVSVVCVGRGWESDRVVREVE